VTIETLNHQGELLPRGLPGLDVINDWLKAGAAVDQLVRPLIESDFIPKSFKPETARNADEEEKATAYRKAVANATAAVLYGMSLGLDPLVSLQQIYVVYGRPGMYTKMKVALAQAAGHRIWDEVYSAERAVVCGQRKDTDDVVRIEITMEMAKTAGWTSNATYQKTPADMLWNRAAARVVDRIAADLLHGIQSIEEIEPDVREPVRPSVPVTVAEIQGRAQSTLGPTFSADPPTSPEVPKEAPVPVKDDVSDTVELINLSQSRKLYATLRDLGAGDKAAGLAVVSTLAGRPVESTKTLTKAEAGPLLDKLEELAKRPEAERRAAIEFMVNPPAPEADQLPIAPERHREREASDREPDDLGNTFDPAVDGR
jgi:hypothetical protein